MSDSRPVPAERDLIEALRNRIERPSNLAGPLSPLPYFNASRRVKLGIGDDCAILDPPRGHEILVTTDFSLETVHFRREWHSPESAGHRCLARGLSDLAAMGAAPLAAFLSLALPAELLRGGRGRPCWRDRFLSGFLSLAARYRVPLAGGDTARSPLLAPPAGRVTGWALADIVLLGSAPRGQALRRSGAKDGDSIYVTGQLGGAAAELLALRQSPRRFARVRAAYCAASNPHPHLFPEPRLAVGAWLSKNKRATAAIDLSDGLSTDLDHLCQESGLAATLHAAAIPLHPLAQKHSPAASDESLQLALHGGEDYELLFTASPAARIPRRIAGVAITRIGELGHCRPRAPRVVLAEIRNGKEKIRPLPPAGWQHYREGRIR